jgi:hypothetical protein
MGADGSAPYNLTPASLLQDPWSSWSPDGTRMAFGSGNGPGFPSGDDAENYTIAPDGQSALKLSNAELRAAAARRVRLRLLRDPGVEPRGQRAERVRAFVSETSPLGGQT